MKRTIHHRGFSLIELMIALLIGIFMVGGLVTLVQAMKRSTVNQGGLSQLQDSERMAMTLITDVIQSTGYFPNPTINTAVSSFPVVGSFTFAGQALVGQGTFANLTPGNNQISVRYVTGGTTAPANDNTINCTGNTSATATMFTNTISVDANGNLVCSLVVNAGAPTIVPLISGVKSMQVKYGVKTNPAALTNSVDTYMDGAAVSAGNNWANVISVQITLNFVNPMFGQPGQTSLLKQTIPFTRVIAVMNKTGVST
jgi:type IV pilus assembly protein PilW